MNKNRILVKSLTVCFGLGSLLGAQTASAVSSYVSRLPNGSVNSCTTCHVSGAIPDLNSFGNDFSIGHTWTPALAKTDSDGDGFTNGQELGDPNGVWVPKAALPIPGAQVTKPGDAASIPVLTPPTIAIASPANGSSFPAPFAGPITSSTTLSTAAVRSVEFFSGANLLGKVTNAPFSLAVNLSAGSYTLTARAVDYLGASNTSSAVMFTVTVPVEPPTITSVLQNQIAVAGTNVIFSINATGGGLLYQWLVNSNAILNANAASLTLTNVRTDQSGFYSVVVSNSAGSAASGNAQLLVVAPAASDVAPVLIPAVLTGQQFNLGFSTLAGYSYSVEYNDALGTTNWTPLFAVPASLSSSNIDLPQALTNAPQRYYRVKISN